MFLNRSTCQSTEVESENQLLNRGRTSLTSLPLPLSTPPPSTLPPSHPHTSLLTTSTNPTGTLLAGGVVSSAPPLPPQFEPVSPDDSDPPPIHSEGVVYWETVTARTMTYVFFLSRPRPLPAAGSRHHAWPHSSRGTPQTGRDPPAGSTFIPPGSHTTTYGMEPIWSVS